MGAGNNFPYPNRISVTINQPCPFLLDNRYLIGQLLGAGGRGLVHIAQDVQTNQLVAVKIDIRTPSSRNCTLLAREYWIYSQLFSRERPEGFTMPKWFYQNDDADFMVLPLLGQTIERFYKENRTEFEFTSVCELGIQMLTRLEYIHGKGFLHLDIKPGNIMLGVRANDATAHLIDFGLSKRYMDETGRQIPYREHLEFKGTKVYASVHMLNGCECSPRDDLESLWYCLVILHKNKLPWTDEDWNPKLNFPEAMLISGLRITSVKMMYRRNLCRGMPESFRAAWRIISNMGYDEVPDYSGLKELLNCAAHENWEKIGLAGSGSAGVMNDVTGK